MFRKRPENQYEGKHRIRVTASGQHKRDPLPPPDIPLRELRQQDSERYLPAPPLTSERYSGIQGIDPNIISPVRPERPRNAPGSLEPRQKIKPRYITAAVFTALLAMPALGMAAWIVQHDADQSSERASYGRLAPNTEQVPMTVKLDGHARQVCITVSNRGSVWTATANDWKC